MQAAKDGLRSDYVPEGKLMPMATGRNSGQDGVPVYQGLK
jgi:hypothetical protein